MKKLIYFLFSEIIQISSLSFFEKFLLEFSECHIDVIEGSEKGYFDFLMNFEYYIATTRLSIEDKQLGEVSLKFNETRRWSRQNCELILASHEPRNEEIQRVHAQFQWLLECAPKQERILKHNNAYVTTHNLGARSIPLCYNMHSYYILLRPLSKPYWKVRK